MSLTVNQVLQFSEALENSAVTACDNCDSTLTTETGNVMTGIAAYKNQIYSIAGGSRTDSAKSVTPAGNTAAQNIALGQIQAMIDSVETTPIINLTKGAGASNNFGYPNALRIVRGALIADLYALYAAQWNILNPR